MIHFDQAGKITYNTIIELTPSETALFRVLWNVRNAKLTGAEIIDKLGVDWTQEANMLAQLILRLRRKLRYLPITIQTYSGGGYELLVESSERS